MSGDAISSNSIAAGAAAVVMPPPPPPQVAQKKCFNKDCGDAESRKGWRLRSGEYANLCDRCALAYEDGKFCEKFHIQASGWRSCESCGKHVHCGCIVSIHSFTVLDAGGIECLACAKKNLVLSSNNGWAAAAFNHSPIAERLKDFSGKIWNHLAGSGPVPWHQAPSFFGTSNCYEFQSRLVYNMDKPTSFNERMSGNSVDNEKVADICERLTNGNPNHIMRDSFEDGLPGVVSLDEANKNSVSRRSVPSSSQFKQMHTSLCNGVEATRNNQMHNGRLKTESRGKNHMLSRYWPRFTNDELRNISANSNSTITPLFEKMLSASDAGRIGRLVLPKKCAEAYFPPISQPEGLPLKIQDSNGIEWIFQFRYWPNNNSRMYVLEGVTPCIQSMQLQAGDIVTFSRLEPESKLIMGYRKASGTPVTDQVELSEAKNMGCVAKDNCSKLSIKKKNNTVGTKKKRLRIDDDDLAELKSIWEESQRMLRPPPYHLPSIVVIEGFEFEEYEDAPVLGKPTIFATDKLGLQSQWVQCDSCCKWRKLPVEALIPFPWTCSANIWDPERSSCSVSQEWTQEKLRDAQLVAPGLSKNLNSPKLETDNVGNLEGLDTLANLAVLEGDEFSEFSQLTTTRHPRHRPGCSCIVCIQPPSGKGPKHKPACACNVCQTVKRRFKTLKMKRQKKQSEKESENSKNRLPHSLDKLVDDDPSSSSATENSTPKKAAPGIECSDDDHIRLKCSTSPFKGQIDLNIQPEHEE